ncbi:MAG: hypothetical protein HQ513_07090 [Rhodospirillales bacterium]|nr:hypothetical protein [Rhodospirillales bacterium]
MTNTLPRYSLKILAVLGLDILVSGFINTRPATACEITEGGVKLATIIEEELAVEALD